MTRTRSSGETTLRNTSERSAALSKNQAKGLVQMCPGLPLHQLADAKLVTQSIKEAISTSVVVKNVFTTGKTGDSVLDHEQGILGSAGV